jgi:cell filamentation protein
MNVAEFQALQIAQDLALDRYGPTHRFAAADVCDLRRLWLGAIYPWAGQVRGVNIGKGGFQFAHAGRVPHLMAELERAGLRRNTPWRPTSEFELARALAEVHAEPVLIHPFRDGNGHLARLLAMLMALQAGYPPLDFTPMAGRKKRYYFAGIQAALERDYGPVTRTPSSGLSRSRSDALLPVRNERFGIVGHFASRTFGKGCPNSFDSGRRRGGNAESRFAGSGRFEVRIGLFQVHEEIIRPRLWEVS